jgi:hypothetical protein
VDRSMPMQVTTWISMALLTARCDLPEAGKWSPSLAYGYWLRNVFFLTHSIGAVKGNLSLPGKGKHNSTIPQRTSSPWRSSLVGSLYWWHLPSWSLWIEAGKFCFSLGYCHRSGGLNARNVFPCFSGSWESKIKVLANSVIGGALS